MTPENFCYWLQGASEVFPSKRPSENEWLVIQDHLKLVFKKETPDRQPLTEVPKMPEQLDILKYPPDTPLEWDRGLTVTC